MKKLNKIIPAFLMLGVSAVMMSTASYAWFSMNQQVDVTGMQVQATADSSLVIGDDLPVGTSYELNFADTAANKLVPITYYEDNSGDAPVYTYKYCSNTSAVDPDTGFAAADPETGLDTTALTDIQSGVGYYKDYVVYIASAGSALGATTLEAQVTFDDDLKYDQNAITVAFSKFEASANAPTIGTHETQVGKVVPATQNTPVDLEFTSIPVNTTEQAVAVLMRVYIDGALKDGDGNAWVRSNHVSLESVGFSVSFKVAQQ